MLFSFFWKHVRPYKWHYVGMLTCTVLVSAYPLAYNFIIKHFIDLFCTSDRLSYTKLAWPILAVVVSQLLLDGLCRLQDMLQWRATPYVNRSMLLAAYDYSAAP